VEALLAGGIQLGSTGVNIADARGVDMPLIYVNEAFQETTGYLSSEVLGRNCHFLQGPDYGGGGHTGAGRGTGWPVRTT
jgi:PAS domain-containing protein